MKSVDPRQVDSPASIRVCFVCPKLYPLLNPDVKSVFGGAEVDLFLLATELAKDQRFEVNCVVADYGQPSEEHRGNIRIIKSLTFRENPLRAAMRIRRAMKHADSHIYMLKTASPGVVLADRFCRRYRRKLVYKTASSSEVDGTYQRKHRLLFPFFLKALRKSLVISQNQSDHELLKDRYSIDSRIIPNGHPIPEDMDVGEKDLILWVGRSDAVKRPELFIDLAQRTTGQAFTMICPQATGDTNYASLRGRSAGLSNLTFLEKVPFDRMDEWYRRAKVLVNTSVYEGFPNTFIQAAKWKGAILSLAVDPDGVLERHSMGIRCGDSMDRLAESLGDLLDNDQYLEYGRRGYEYVSERHDIERIAEEYKTIFKELAGDGAD